MRLFNLICKHILVMVFMLSINHPGSAQNSFYKFHALFLYNFTKHIQWNNIGNTFVVGVYGSDNALRVINENLAGKKYGSKTIEVIRVNNPVEAKNCQIVYFPKSNKGKVIGFMEAIDKKDKLMVTEDDLIQEGASISFVIKESRLHFKISKPEVDQARLKVSGALFSLGLLVE